jgi:hypothetical protein
VKLVIFGSRNAYPSIAEVERAVASVCDLLNQDLPDDAVVVCGMARGADECGKQWAEHNGVTVKEFPADWEQHGKRAGFIRNKAMAEYADAGIGFWKDESGGTANMTTQLVVLGKPVHVVRL